MEGDDLVDLIQAFVDRDERGRLPRPAFDGEAQQHQGHDRLRRRSRRFDHEQRVHIAIPPTFTAKQAIKTLVDTAEKTEFINNLYVVENGILVGVLSLKEVISAGKQAGDAGPRPDGREPRHRAADDPQGRGRRHLPRLRLHASAGRRRRRPHARHHLLRRHDRGADRRKRRRLRQARRRRRRRRRRREGDHRRVVQEAHAVADDPARLRRAHEFDRRRLRRRDRGDPDARPLHAAHPLDVRQHRHAVARRHHPALRLQPSRNQEGRPRPSLPRVSHGSRQRPHPRRPRLRPGPRPADALRRDVCRDACRLPSSSPSRSRSR
ncbi:MAG: CBS domain-containing protein [Bacillus subtilis]|nr:CBS domain-containing protein [Bacillus subtilis]